MKKFRFKFLIILHACLTSLGLQLSATNPVPAVFTMPAKSLAETRARLVAAPNDSHLAPALIALRVEADAALTITPASVTDNELLAASGDKHDYFSIGPYWWPDPKKPTGLPWVRRDGKTNPASRDGTDFPAFRRICQSVQTLGLAYYFTGHEPYAQHAVRLTRVWFLDEATCMNPNLNYAQAIPGLNDGRAIGVIEGTNLVFLTEGLALIEAHGATINNVWTAQDRADINKWFTAYFDWLLTSPNGTGAAKLANNIATWYDAQAVQIALVLGNTKQARQMLATAHETRLLKQVLPDGRQPGELERASPLGYLNVNLNALLTLASQAASLDGELGRKWWFEPAPGEVIPRLRKALEFVAPYANPKVVWTSHDGKGGNQLGARPAIRTILAHAASVYSDAPFLALLQPQLTGDSAPNFVSERWQLFISQPVN